MNFRLPLASALSLLPCLAFAQPVPEPRPDTAPPPDWRGTLSVSIENDKFGVGTDRFYSNGFQLSWRSASADLPRPLEWTNRQLEALMGPGELRWGMALSHSIFTPRDTRRTNPDPSDRPYVGMLMASVSLSRASERSLTLVELQAGMVGPSALGEQIQNGFHRAIGVDRSYGWDRQIHDEPVVNLLAERKWRMPLGQFAGLEFEAMPSVSVSVGNANTYGAVGGIVRFGQGLQADYGPARISPALAGSNYFQPNADRTGREWGWYMFAGLEGRGVARDIALQGNSWRDSRHVDARPFVADVQAGLAVYWRQWRVAYTQVIRSEEFYGQRGGPQIFGSINLSMRF